MPRGLLVGALAALALVPASQARMQGGSPVALVTAETVNRVVAVQLPSGRVLRRIPLPADPENVVAAARVAVVASPRAGAVTLVGIPSLRVVRILHGFGTPHIVALARDLTHAFVTDDARGQLDVIDLVHRRVVARIAVGLGAHHMAVDAGGNELWIALGERARSITVVDTSNAAAPRVVGHVDPHGLAHDLAFSPDGRRVWVTYDDRARIGVFDAASGRLLHWIPSGPPPQHLAFDGFRRDPHAYVTSGSDGTVRIMSSRTGRLERLVHVPVGSFNLGLGGSFVATSSLYRGTLTELADADGRILLSERVAPSARDVAIALLP